MLKTKILKDTPTPIVYGSNEEVRDWAISVLAEHIRQSSSFDAKPLPPEAYLTFERLVNSRFLDHPVKALAQDLESLNDRIKHLEASINLRMYGQTKKQHG